MSLIFMYILLGKQYIQGFRNKSILNSKEKLNKGDNYGAIHDEFY